VDDKLVGAARRRRIKSGRNKRDPLQRKGIEYDNWSGVNKRRQKRIRIAMGGRI